MLTRKHYLLALLTVILAFNYTDRFALGVALEDIKRDLHATDAQLGLLSGIAFALFYSVMGIPIARWADRSDRVAIIAVATAVWSAAVALCGAARGLGELILIRIGVGVGEAGCVPPALSLIADYFSRAERARATSVYLQGISVAMIFGYFASGWLNAAFGWREMFVMIGLPGLLLGALCLFTLREPRKGAAIDLAAQVKFASAWASIWGSITYRHIVYSSAVIWFFTYGTMQWAPAFYERSFGLTTGILGTWLALVYGVGNVVGTHLGGELCSRYATRNESRQLKIMAVATALSGIFYTLVYLPIGGKSPYLSLTWLGLANILGAISNGPLFAVIQTLMPEKLRATAFSILYFFANLIGLGLGPWVAGILSDGLAQYYGGESLRYAMLLLSPGFLWGAWHVWRANQTVGPEMATMTDRGERLREAAAWSGGQTP